MRILLADGDIERAKPHADACAARGYVVDRVDHGAAALELALRRVPDIVICPIALPVIDGERLAAILRGNPRTQEASFIFLVQDELDAPMSMDPRDGTVVAPWHEEDVLDYIDAFLERSARFSETRQDTEIEGKLTQISLVDLLQIFQMNKRSGTIRIWRGGSTGSGSILVKNGQILDASVPLADGSAVVGEKALYRLLTWKEGRFEFAPGTVPESGRISKPSRALLLEGMRQLDEWSKFRRELPSEDTRLVLAQAADQIRGSEHALTAEVLDAVEAYRRVGEVVDHCPFPDFQVLRALQELIQSGGLTAETSSGPTTGRGEDSILTQSQLARIHEWTAARRPRAGSVLKLLVAGASPAQIRGVHQLLRECPDFMTETRLARDPSRVGGLGALGHFSLGEGLMLRVLAVPAQPTYAAIWGVAAHGMLGAIVVPRSPEDSAFEETEPVARRLSEERPESLVHLLLADDPSGGFAERAPPPTPPDGEGSLLILPAPPSPERLGVLRELFSRLVP